MGLEAERQNIGRQSLDRGVAEQGIRRAPKLYRNLGRACRQALASAQIERHAGPSPIVDGELERQISFSPGIRRNVWLVPVSRNLLSAHAPTARLATDCVLRRDAMYSSK